MKFKNPANGHVEERNLAWLWTLLFGGLYFIANGLVAPLLIWIIIAALLYSGMGPPATVIVLFMDIVFAIFAGGMIRSAYLRKGWIEVSEEQMVAELAPARTLPKFRKCPFCAEEIRAEAIKCKHCGSAVEAEASAIASNQDSHVDVVQDGECLMDRYGITYANGKYHYQAYQYGRLEDALAYAQLQASRK